MWIQWVSYTPISFFKQSSIASNAINVRYSAFHEARLSLIWRESELMDYDWAHRIFATYGQKKKALNSTQSYALQPICIPIVSAWIYFFSNNGPTTIPDSPTRYTPLKRRNFSPCIFFFYVLFFFCGWVGRLWLGGPGSIISIYRRLGTWDSAW